MKTVVSTPAAPQAIGPYSQAVVSGDLIFLSGQLGILPADGSLPGTTAAAQAEQALTNIKAVLEAAGSSLEQVVKTTVFLTDLGEFAAVNAVYARFFKAPFPARSTVQVAALPKGARVEIEVIAVRA